MKSLPRTAELAVFFLLWGFLAPAAAGAQSSQHVLTSPDRRVVVVRSVRALPDRNGPILEIICDHALVPVIRKLEDPPRLVIDLPNARFALEKKQIDFHSREVSGMRADQFQASPPIARIVVDLTRPVTYSWEPAGNRLWVHLRSSEENARPALGPAATVSSGAPRPVVLGGSRIATGSSVTAGSDTAHVQLGRGGEVRVCPGTTVSVTSSQNGRALMLGMSTGALEAHYSLDASADSILTPDFRILLAGPGEFHYGVSADSRGNTCIQALPGNTASVIVSELLGDGTYQVKPTEQVVFRSGQLKSVDNLVPGSCGCPAPVPAVMRAGASPLSTPRLGAPAPVSPETAALPSSKSGDVHVQVEAPFVFTAKEPPAAQPTVAPPPQPAPIREAALLPARELRGSVLLLPAALPPPQAKAMHHGFLGKIKGFFVTVFG